MSKYQVSGVILGSEGDDAVFTNIGPSTRYEAREFARTHGLLPKEWGHREPREETEEGSPEYSRIMVGRKKNGEISLGTVSVQEVELEEGTEKRTVRTEPYSYNAYFDNSIIID